MNPVAIVTDSTNGLPPEFIERLGIHEVSLYVTYEGKAVRETEIKDYKHFFDSLRADKAPPTTSQPSVGDFLEVYEPLLANGYDILSIHISGGLSGTVETAQRACEQLVEGGEDLKRFRIYDSQTAAGALGIVTLAGANAARAGADLTSAYEAARSMRASMNIWFTIDTLEFLRLGGRIGTCSAWLGTALQIRPILTVESTIEPIERVRTSKRAIARLMEQLESQHAAGCDIWFAQHIQSPDQVGELIAKGTELYGYGPEFVSELSPVLGAHVGPGLFGVTAVERRLLEPNLVSSSAQDIAQSHEPAT